MRDLDYSEADRDYEEDLHALQAQGLGEFFQDLLASFPDPDTDGMEHD